MKKSAKTEAAEVGEAAAFSMQSEWSPLERFILRLRLVAAHSLAQDRELLERTATAGFQFQVTRNLETGVEVWDLQPVPLLPAEQLESAIARVRPLLVTSDGIDYESILTSKMPTISEEQCSEVDAVLRAFREADPDSSIGRPREPRGPGEPTTDKRIAGAWLYGNLVHADAIRQTFAEGMSLESVLMVAQRMTCGLVLASLDALSLLKRLAAEGVIEVNDRAFERQVETRATEWAPQEARVYSAPVGTAMPTSLDEPVGEEWEEGLPDLLEITPRVTRNPATPGARTHTGNSASETGSAVRVGSRLVDKG